MQQPSDIDAPCTQPLVDNSDGEGVEGARINSAKGSIAAAWAKFCLFCQPVEAQFVVAVEMFKQPFVQIDEVEIRFLLPCRLCRRREGLRLVLLIVTCALFFLCFRLFFTAVGLFLVGIALFGGLCHSRRLLFGILLGVVPFLFQLTQQPSKADF